MRHLRYLVTGCAGFLGHSLLNELLKYDSTKEIRALDIEDDKEPVDDIRVVYIRGSVNDYSLVLSAARNVDVVFHLAADMDFSEWADTEHMFYVNVAGTDTVIKACEEAGE